MTQVEQIKAEIEQRITDNTFGAKMELIDLLAFIDSLPEEKPSEDLEKAAIANAHPDYYNEKVIAYNPERKEAFILGANWQKRQMQKED